MYWAGRAAGVLHRALGVPELLRTRRHLRGAARSAPRNGHRHRLQCLAYEVNRGGLGIDAVLHGQLVDGVVPHAEPSRPGHELLERERLETRRPFIIIGG